jgi:AsmA protein
MRRLLIPAGVVVVVLGAVLAVVVANLGRFVGAHRQWLADRVEDEIGRPITFGDVGVSLRGGPGVRVSDVRIPDDPSYGGGDLLRAREVWVTVRLWPALVGRYEIGRIVLRAPVLTVIRDERGFNLDTLGRRPREPEHRGPDHDRQRSGLPLLVIGLLNLRDGAVHYVDRRVEPARELALERVDVSASDVTLDRPIDVVARATLPGAAPANLELTGSVGPLGDQPAVGLMPLDLRLDAPSLDAAALPAAAAVLDLSLPARLSVDGPLAIRARTQGTLDQLSVEGSIDATRAAVRWGADFAKVGDLALEAGVSGARDGGRTEIRHASVRLGGLQVDATGTIRPREAIDVRIDSNRAGLAALAAVLPAAAGADIGGDVEAHLTIQGPLATGTLPAISGTVALDGARARRAQDTLGVSDLTTTITLADGVARMPATRFRLGTDAVEASGTFALADRLLTIDRASGALFGGSAEGSARVDLRHHKRPHFTVDATARRVALQPLLSAFGARLAPHVEGVLDATLSLSGGGRPARVRHSLAGTVRADVSDGVLRGVNLVEGVLGGVTGVEGVATLAPASLRASHPELFGAADTRFEELHATARLADGQARTDDLVLRTPAYTVTGAGTAALAGGLDLTGKLVAGKALTADVLGTIKDARWAVNDQQLLEIPFRLTGRLPDVRIKPDSAFVARVVGRALADRAGRLLGGKGGADDKNRKDGKGGKNGLVDDAIRGLERLLNR